MVAREVAEEFLDLAGRRALGDTPDALDIWTSDPGHTTTPPRSGQSGGFILSPDTMGATGCDGDPIGSLMLAQRDGRLGSWPGHTR
jgi:hypothetical protein